MIVYTRGKLRGLLKVDFIRFCIVGGTGFLINLLLLSLFHKQLGLSVFWSQLIGAEVALFSNFMLHHHWTYKNNKVQKDLLALLLQFHATTWPAIIGSSVMLYIGVDALHFSSLAVLVFSSAVTLAWNFAWSKYVIWRDITQQQVERIM